jgi:hypothetical protein
VSLSPPSIALGLNRSSLTTRAPGAAAAAPEEGALVCPSASPHLPVVARWKPRSRAILGTVGG